MIYSGKLCTTEQMVQAIDDSGVYTKEIIPIMSDFMTDTYWDDPKCISRRIRICGGDPVRFYNKMEEFGYTFIN